MPSIDHEDLLEFDRLADVVVAVPEGDGLPVTLLDAMASGCPIVATRLAGVSDALGEAARPFLVPVGDAAATAEAITRALALAPEERLRIGRELRGVAHAHGEMKRILEDMEREYRRLAGP